MDPVRVKNDFLEPVQKTILKCVLKTQFLKPPSGDISLTCFHGKTRKTEKIM